MPDNRSLRQKLQAMANDTSSPNEAAIAQRKLDELPPDVEPYPSGGFTVPISQEIYDDRTIFHGSSVFDILNMLDPRLLDDLEAQGILVRIYRET